LAYRIGREGEFRLDRSEACCRLNENTQGFQIPERRLSSGDVARNIDILDLLLRSDSKLHLGDAEIPLSPQPHAPDRRRAFYLAVLIQPPISAPAARRFHLDGP